MEPQLEDESFGRRLHRLREGKEISLRKLAETSGIARSYLYQLESDESSPTLEKLEALAEALGVKPADLMADLPEEIPESLRQFAEEERLTNSEIELLRNVNYRGRRPESTEEWKSIWDYIRFVLTRQR